MRNPNWQIAFISLLLPFFFYLSYQNAKHWLSDTSLWQHNYLSQKGPSFTKKYLNHLLFQPNNNFDPHQTFRLLDELKKSDYAGKNKDIYHFSIMWQAKIFLNSKISIKEKIEFLKQVRTDSYQEYYFYSRLYFELNDYKNARKNIKDSIKCIKNHPQEFLVKFNQIYLLNKQIQEKVFN